MQTVPITVIIPVYNEVSTIRKVIERVVTSLTSLAEIIVVDDGSNDGTVEILKVIQSETSVRVLFQPENQGKTSAVIRGLAEAKGTWAVVQDADLEYDPNDIKVLFEKAKLNPHAAIYGRRPGCWHMPSRWIFAVGVLFIDIAIFAFYRRCIRDHATCYKLVPREMLNSFTLESTGFEGCIEITAKLMRSGIPIIQIPITYAPRGVHEGKKLTVGYGPRALAAVWKYRSWKKRVGE